MCVWVQLCGVDDNLLGHTVIRGAPHTWEVHKQRGMYTFTSQSVALTKRWEALS